VSEFAIRSILLAVLVAGGIWGVHLYNQYQQQIGYDRAVAEYKEKENEAIANARKTEAGLRKQLADAISAAARRNQRVDTAVAAASSATDSLRDTLNTYRDSVPSATAAALVKSVNALTTVLGDCGAKYQGVAEKADRHAADAKMIHDSWPSYEKK